jgi:hypothetical protein
MSDKSLISSYVSHGEDLFHVHTFDRDSSAAGGPARYSATLVWVLDAETKYAVALVGEFGTSEGLIYRHFNVCRALFDQGISGLDGIE